MPGGQVQNHLEAREMTEERKFAILFAVTILAARRLISLTDEVVEPVPLLGSLDSLDIRGRVNLPSGRPPVVCAAWIRIFRRICVL